MEDYQFENYLKSLDGANIHLSSYNHFIIHELPLLVQNLTAVLSTPKTDGNDCKITLDFFGVHVPTACALKNGIYQPINSLICRREKLSYMSPVFASIKQTKYLQDRVSSVNIIKDVVIAHVPVMVGSCICHTTRSKDQRKLESLTDKGGYFIINGVERVLVTQRRKCYNIPQILEQNGVYTVNMRSMSKETSHSVLIEISCSDLNSISCSVPYTKKSIPLSILVKAFGKTSREFEAEIGVENYHLSARDDLTENDALEYIGALATKKQYKSADEEEAVPEEESSEDEELEEWEDEEEESTSEPVSSIERTSKIEYAKQIIDTEMFPHLGVHACSEVKFKTVCSMVRLLVLAKAGNITADNRDNLFFHRFETSGILLYELYGMCFRNFFNTYKECGKDGAITDFTNKLEGFVTKNVKSCMAKGRWGMQKSYVREGVSQQLARYSILGTQSHLHRLMLPVGKEGKNVKIRLIHPSHFGFVCLFETPEGQGCGIVLNFTASVIISKEYSATYLRDLVQKYIQDETKEVETHPVNVWIDNIFVIKTYDAERFVKAFKSLRGQNVIPEQVSIYVYEDKWRRPYEIRIFGDKGRVMRPLLSPTGTVVYLDPAEIQNNYVAVSKEEIGWDYCELHPVLLLSICAGAIPFSDHIQSPRIVYESSMLKQAIGFFTNTYPIRYDTTCEVLDYAQKALVSTKIGRAFGMHDAPAGVNCVVAIMTKESWNAEDCIVMNRGAIERGLFSSTTYKTITVEEYKVKSNDTRRFCLPPEAIRKQIYNYSLLDENGIIKKGSKVSRKDVIIGCVQEIVTKGNAKKEVIEKDCSELSDEEGIVQSVEVVTSFSGNRIANIVLKIIKIPECGDKFANLNAQKGTCGLILPPEDMPFCMEDGIIPDILVNPNALPSRMTISMFLEFVLGQECALSGNFGDATPFEKINGLGEVLIAHGYDKLGDKVLVDGATGKPYKARIFMGVNYYQKLKHMVSNKINARNFGNVTVSTRQPVSGRSKQGGIRAGEMEVQGWLSHGVGDFLKEKLFDCSDAFTVLICPDCGVISNHKDQCHICQGELYETDLPYASKIVFQILNMCSIKTKFEIKLK